MFLKHLVLLIFTASLNLAFNSSAQATLTPEGTVAVDTVYFTIDDSPSKPAHFASPLNLITEGMKTLAPSRGLHQLLKWVRHAGPPAAPTEPYNRKKHFGSWINDPTDSTCFNTRTKVLIRDADGQVTYQDNNHCKIESGKWQDPYTGTIKVSTEEVQIDHVVPLKHAYDSGAAKWTQVKRCLYANYLGNSYHLLSVDGSENMRKGSDGPDQYLPPNSRFVCNYLQDWLRIKLIWSMTLTASETQAISKAVAEYNCQPSDLTMSQKDLAEQRTRTTDLQDICEKQVAQNTNP